MKPSRVNEGNARQTDNSRQHSSTKRTNVKESDRLNKETVSFPVVMLAVDVQGPTAETCRSYCKRVASSDCGKWIEPS